MMKLKTIRNLFPVLAAVIALSVELPAQTLARPGWVGSGLTAQTWFKHAIFYEIDTRTFSRGHAEPQDGSGDLKGIAEHLDYIHSLGADAILLEPLSQAQTSGQIDPALGTLDDFDDLTLQASRLKVRIILELPAPDAALARFWLNRGVAGFYVPGNDPSQAAALQAIRKLLPGYVGQRVLITDRTDRTDAGTAASSSAKTSSNELLLDRAKLKSAAAPNSSDPTPDLAPDLRAALDRSQALSGGGTTVFTISGAAVADPNLARVTLAAVLLNRSASLILAGQELGMPSGTARTSPMPWGQAAPPPVETEAEPEKKPPPPVVAAVPDKYQPYVPYVRPVAPKKPPPADPATVAGQDVLPGSLLQFSRELSVLHHGNTALHDGEQITLNLGTDGVLAWVRKPSQPSQFNSPIVIACNLRAEPVVLSLRPEMTRLQLRGNFLRTLLRSDDAMGGPPVDQITLPAFGVFVGELRY